MARSHSGDGRINEHRLCVHHPPDTTSRSSAGMACQDSPDETLGAKADSQAGQWFNEVFRLTGSIVRTLAHRNRKRGSSTLSSLTPPVRLDDSTFTVMGARDVVLPRRSLYLRSGHWSFQIVEVWRTHRGVNGALGERRYALHLQPSSGVS